MWVLFWSRSFEWHAVKGLKLKVWTLCYSAAYVSQTQEQLACADFPNIVAQRHILGVRTQGAMTPKFELGRDFCTMHLPLPQVSSSYVYSFWSYRVDKQTNKQADAAENIQRSSLRYDVG